MANAASARVPVASRQVGEEASGRGGVLVTDPLSVGTAGVPGARVEVAHLSS
jgi:hypothetical protein